MANNEAHNALVREALQELAIKGYTAWKNETGVWFEYSIVNGNLHRGRPHKYGKTGSGDIFIVLQRKVMIDGYPYTIGQHVEAEAKTGTGRQSDNQSDHQKFCVEKNGGVYILFRSVEELLCQLQKIK